MLMTDQELRDAIRSKAAGDGSFAIAWAVLTLAAAQERTAAALRMLGTGDAATSMGAIEFLAKETKEGSHRIADALTEIASNIPVME